jgi:ubiquinone/menaquinone biosynthesis C-methylase UbiE
MKRTLLVLLASVAAAFQASGPGNPSTKEDFQAGDASREPYQRASDLLATLQIARGDWVADVGAGAGYYSMRISELAGPEGKVFAEDISDSSMRWLGARIKAFDLGNVEVVKGEANDPRLPAGRLSAVLIVDSYHHFTDYKAMLGKILQALRAGGRLVIADYSTGELRALTREPQIKRHTIDPELVRGEVSQAGFRVVRCEDPFVARNPAAKSARAAEADFWVLVAVRPY